MLIAVLYREADGTIIQTMMGQQHMIERTAEVMNLAWLQVDEQRDDYDVLYVVHEGKLALKAEFA